MAIAAFLSSARLPVDVETGATGGPGFKTTIVTLASGREQRNVDWVYRRGRYDIGYAAREASTYEAVVALFHVCRGRTSGFRFRDYSDYIGEGEALGVGDDSTTEFQLVKTYTDGGQSYIRDIRHLVSGTLVVYSNGAVVSDSNYSVGSTGLITFNSAPTIGETLTADFEFDVPVRFDTDQLEVEMITSNIGAVPSIPLVELAPGDDV